MWAYNVVWIGFAAFGIVLFVRLSRVSRRIDRLERAGTGGAARDRPGQ